MKYAKFYAFCACVFLLCTVCLTFTVSAASSPHYTVIAVPHEENGILTTENGQKWYKVKGFENDTQYILTVRDRDGVQNILAVTNDVDTAGIWSFYRSSMSTSTAPRIATLSAAGYSMTCSGNKLMPYYDGVEAGDRTWAHENSMLCWYGSDRTMYLKYNPGSDEPFSMTADRTQAAEVLIYSCGTTLTRCITQQPQAESYVIEGSSYPAPSFSVGLADVTVDSIRWFADGAEQPCGTPVFTADILKDQPAGVHRVSCAVAAHDSDGYHYREQSAEATFVITKGVVPDSIMTFSDIHEEYGLIRDAIRTVMQKTGGYIPALVICSGDFVNGPTMQTDLELSRYFPQIVSALGGLDAVYVAGNLYRLSYCLFSYLTKKLFQEN